MKGGRLPEGCLVFPEEVETVTFTVTVFRENDAQIWMDGDDLRWIEYNTGDKVYFDEEGNVETVLTHDGHVVNDVFSTLK